MLVSIGTESGSDRSPKMNERSVGVTLRYRSGF